MHMNTLTLERRQTVGALGLDALRNFVEYEADLLDRRRFDDWYALYADDGVYWVPARHDQESWLNHVSLFFDEKHTLKTRVTRLQHPMLHCQEPPSACVRVLSGFRLEQGPGEAGQADDVYRVSSKFMMIEDRPGSPQRIVGGRYSHLLRHGSSGLSIVQKRVDLTNCDQSFPMLTQPF
jgi:3-phenylpropionate/cinnamic acid dioxygenase small subunit